VPSHFGVLFARESTAFSSLTQDMSSSMARGSFAAPARAMRLGGASAKRRHHHRVGSVSATRRAPAPPRASVGAVISPTLETNPALTASTKARLVAVVPGGGAVSFLPYPPGLPEDARPAGAANGAGPDWMEVMSHMALRLTWVDPGFAMDVFSHDAPLEDIAKSAKNADVFIVVGVNDVQIATALRDVFASVPTGAALGCCSLLTQESRVAFQPVTEMRAMEAKLVPWGQANKDLKLMDQVVSLFKRENHLDLLFLHLLLIDASGTRVAAVDINQDLNLGNVWCIAKNCNKQLFECYKNENCVKSLDCIDACGLNDQVCTYTCIRSYQNDQFQLLARCMLHKNNCLGNDAVRPALPEVMPMRNFRGQPLTHDVAEGIMQGHYGDGPDQRPYSWLAVAGQNPAYDHFPCQYQIWYRGKAKNSFWYNPVFKVRTLEGEEVWRRSDYRCKRGDTPGTFYFSFMDNGVTSLEYWRVVDASDDLSWSLYYYAGAAKVAGQAYIGAVLATKDGTWPEAKHLPRIEKSLWEGCGVKLWEMCEVDNSTCQGAPLDPYHETALTPSLVAADDA